MCPLRRLSSGMIMISITIITRESEGGREREREKEKSKRMRVVCCIVPYVVPYDYKLIRVAEKGETR